MAGKFGSTTIGALLASDGGSVKTGPFGTTLKAKEYSTEGVPLISVGEIGYGSLRLHASTPRAPREVVERLPEYILEAGDIVFGRKGAVDRSAMVKPEQTGWFLGSDGIRLRLPNSCDARFIAYQLQSGDTRSWLLQHATGTTMASLNQGTIERLPIVLPPLDEQRAIAHILGTLDDKIELNRQMIETLEAIARVLFKSWFMEFDPVRAKAEGRDPGLPKSLAVLFPSSFEDSELGEIPKDWEVGTLGDVLRQRVERCEASDETASRPYVPIDCITSRSLFLAESKPGMEAQSSLTRFYNGDLLFGAMRPYFHKVCIAPFDGTTRTTAFVLVPKRSQDFGFATLLLHHPDTIDYATRHSTGSTIPYAVWTSSLEDMPAVIPPPQVREGFDAAVRPMLDRIPRPYFENRTLAALRDTLLPKLISGELRIEDADRFVQRHP